MSWLFLYKIVFVTELIIAEAMLTYSYPKRKGFAYLCPISVLACYAITALYPSQTVNSWLSSSVMFFFLFSTTICAMAICFKVKFFNLLFSAIAAYTVQHLSYLLFSLVNVTLLHSQAFISYAYNNDGSFSLSLINGMMAISFVLYVALYFLVYLASQTLLKKRMNRNGDLNFKSIETIGFVAFALIADIVVSDALRYATDVSDFFEVFYCLLSILLCVSLLFLQMSTLKSKDVEKEMEILSRLYDEQQKHYKIRKETIDLINIKCHDFKHQIQRVGSNRGVNDETLQEMSELISFYDADINTGNKSLDVMLTEKSLLCREKGIDFTCIANGKLLSFMKESDLYALVGNILDNAIEATSKIKDKTKKCVNFIVEKRAGAVVVREDNYYAGEIQTNEAGLIDTIKEDKRYHGYGMKSIRHVSEKYGGIMNVEVDNGIFRLSVVFFS